MIYLMSIFFVSVLVACAASYVLTLLKKWGFVEWLQINGNDFFSRMAWCDFCLSWWLCCIITFALFLWSHDLWLAVVPFCSTPITRRLQ